MMIEQFSKEQLEIIKRELGIKETTNGSKSTILADQKARMYNLINTEKRSHARVETWDALTKICDNTLENYQRMEGMAGWGGRGEKWHRYASIFNVEKYTQMMNDLLDVMEKYKGE